jgi:hypothetical protein
MWRQATLPARSVVTMYVTLLVLGRRRGVQERRRPRTRRVLPEECVRLLSRAEVPWLETRLS